MLVDVILAAAATESVLRVDGYVDRRAYIDALVHYDCGRDMNPLAELIQVVSP